MMHWNVPKASIAPAIVLSVIVGFTFATLRKYGPESTVRSFHATLRRIYLSQMDGKGIPRKDWDSVRAMLVEDAGVPFKEKADPRALAVVNYIFNSVQKNATYSLAKMDRFPNEVRIAILYKYPDQTVIPVIWVVVRDPVTKEWRISAAKTALA
jgi:hypothetical protein